MCLLLGLWPIEGRSFCSSGRTGYQHELQRPPLHMTAADQGEGGWYAQETHCIVVSTLVVAAVVVVDARSPGCPPAVVDGSRRGKYPVCACSR